MRLQSLGLNLMSFCFKLVPCASSRLYHYSRSSAFQAFPFVAHSLLISFFCSTFVHAVGHFCLSSRSSRHLRLWVFCFVWLAFMSRSILFIRSAYTRFFIALHSSLFAHYFHWKFSLKQSRWHSKYGPRGVGARGDPGWIILLGKKCYLIPPHRVNSD